MAYDIGKCNEMIKASFPDRRLHISIGRSVRFYSLVCLVALMLGIIGVFMFSGAIAVRFVALSVLAVAFLIVFALFNLKKLKYLYSIKDKKVVPVLVPIQNIYSGKSLRGSVMTKVSYRWPVGTTQVINAEFPGETGPLIVKTDDPARQYALALCVDKKDKGPLKPYLMDKRLSRCLLSKPERLAILRTIRAINKAAQ
ncbi:hypothetical protein PE074_07985 [Wohlfahrtiimonas chitiniclastica]|uniref:Uncharacterized protein n=2 Tax=Wohlfahrtiimonas chitiniclastica TaxID=400946 RepID=L8Y1Q1_9GAMM|nr:hypothetical protein [Wohlfahrtiimonas chitiniclastica]ELV08880.1 Hypothetical protein F387_00273 [Wohlfahrtiimonas chitiniclastica SH04]KZS22557.1 hypothetical protein BMY_0378 [Wohlfahrtiimonas chitiniclastica]KZX38058.1 hypothetical protein A6V30_04010 [Wohlfahrtiimonas chitiniclastica]MBS7813865.1 hypothetical protein [Wohlfahrtiimonas chitiniclastica]MBS7816129.1 hypothetical protein [Wohlfahrtiimonas chitiniclastica]